jgi:FkbM family methyltransferase
VLNVWKPWYVYRPGQLLRRVVRAAFPRSNPIQVVILPWGCPIEIDTREVIGRSIWATGVYDLAVAETLYRLADPGELALDVGANIGAMTGVLARRAGEVWAFEPHPAVGRTLRGNVARFTGRPGFAPVRVFDLAASDADGTATLHCPSEFDGNHGTARLTAEGDGVVVRTARLDGLLGDRPVGLMKIDVEGHEPAVFRGLGPAGLKRVVHVVFEAHDGPGGESGALLAAAGFTVFAIGWRVRGPIAVPTGAAAHHPYEAPSYLATRRPDEVARRFRPRGWECLSPRR